MLQQVRKEVILRIILCNESVIFEISEAENDTSNVENPATSEHHVTTICMLQVSTIKIIYAKLQCIVVRTESKKN